MRVAPLVSRSALALVIGVVALAAQPALAQKKDKKKEKDAAAAAAAAAPAIAPSKAYLPEAKKVQTAYLAKDAAALEAALAAAEPFATTPQDKFLQGQFRLGLGGLKNDPTIQSAALDAMLETGLTPAADLGRFNFFSGRFAYDNKDYPKAITRLSAAKAAGSTEIQLPLLIVDSMIKTNRLDEALALTRATVLAERAAGRVPLDDYYVRVGNALRAAKRRDDALDLLTMRVQDRPAAEVWRNTMRIFLEGADKDMTLDTYRLMRSAGVLTEKSEVGEYAALAAESGLPGEVVRLIEEARAKGVVPAKDLRFDETYASQKARTVGDKAALDADAAKGAALPTARRARSTADALYGYGDYAKAAALYQVALDKGDLDPDLVTLRLGVSQHRIGNDEAAKATLAKVGGARKRLANLWLVSIAGKQAPAVAPTAPVAPAPTTGR